MFDFKPIIMKELRIEFPIERILELDDIEHTALIPSPTPLTFLPHTLNLPPPPP